MGFGSGFFWGWLIFSGPKREADPAGCLFLFEMVMISGTIVFLYESWWIFFLSVAALFAIIRFKFLFAPLLILLSGFWGLGAYSVCEREGFTFSNKVLITLLALVLAGSAHYIMWGRLKRSH